MTNIGFIGLGNMGLPMAQNLLSAGHQVYGFDLVSEASMAAELAGVVIEKSARDAASKSEAVILMLPNGKIANDVLEDIADAIPQDGLLIDCSTIDIASARRLHERAEASSLLCLDAPVSGGVGGAAAGTLTFMVGGSEEGFEAAKPYFAIMGHKAIHCGEGGAGQAAKICNNMLLGISMIGVCESFALAEKLGLDQQALFDIISTSSGSCWSVNNYCPVEGVGPQSPADNDYKPGFSAALMLKDLTLAQEAAESEHATTPLGKHAAALYKSMVEAGMGGSDFSGMIRYLSNDKE